MHSLFRIEKKDDQYRIQIEADLPASWETWREFLTEDYVLVGFSLLLFLIISGVFFGNLVIFGFVLRFSYLIVLYFGWSLVFRINPRFQVGVALFFLVFSSFFLWRADEPRANLAALVAFAFLSMGVLFLVVEHLREKNMSLETEKGVTNFLGVSGTKPLPSAGFEVQDDSAAATDAEHFRKEESFALPRVTAKKRRRRSKLRLIGAVSLVSFLAVAYMVAVSFNLFKTKPNSISKPSSSEKKLTVKRVARRKKMSEDESKTPTKKIDKGAIKIDVLNGNGIKGEATIVANALKQSGYDVKRAENANNYNYAQTELRYKKGNKEAADLLAKDLSQYYPCTLKENLSANFSSDIVLVLGKDKKASLPQAPVDKSSCIIDVLNGNGIKGSAKQVAGDLKTSDFRVRNVGDAKRFNYSQTIIQYKPGRQEIAEQIAVLIKSRYAAVLKEDGSSSADIVIILGNR